HLAQASVDMRVVDDLADEIDAPVGKLLARLIRVLYRALHPVAEPEFAGQTKRDVANREGVVLRPHPVDDPATVVSGQVFLNFGLEAETLAEVGTWVGGRHWLKVSGERSRA